MMSINEPPIATKLISSATMSAAAAMERERENIPSALRLKDKAMVLRNKIAKCCGANNRLRHIRENMANNRKTTGMARKTRTHGVGFRSRSMASLKKKKQRTLIKVRSSYGHTQGQKTVHGLLAAKKSQRLLICGNLAQDNSLIGQSQGQATASHNKDHLHHHYPCSDELSQDNTLHMTAAAADSDNLYHHHHHHHDTIQQPSSVADKNENYDNNNVCDVDNQHQNYNNHSDNSHDTKSDGTDVDATDMNSEQRQIYCDSLKAILDRLASIEFKLSNIDALRDSISMSEDTLDVKSNGLDGVSQDTEEIKQELQDTRYELKCIKIKLIKMNNSSEEVTYV